MNAGLTNIAAAALIAYGAHGCDQGSDGFAALILFGLFAWVEARWSK